MARGGRRTSRRRSTSEVRRRNAQHTSQRDGIAREDENKKARGVRAFLLGWVPDNDLLSHGQSVLSSARCRFTVLFGMGRSGSSRLWSSGVEGAGGALRHVRRKVRARSAWPTCRCWVG